MNRRICHFLTVAVLLVTGFQLVAQPDQQLASQVNAIVSKARAKVASGLRSETAYAAELKEYDDLAAAHSNRPADAANILYLKAMMYVEVFQNNAKAIEIIRGIKRDYPDTATARRADEVIILLTHSDDAKKTQRTLIVGANFPDFMEKDTGGQILNTATLRGKVFLLDFGSTFTPQWCQESTNVVAAYKKFHAQGFEVVSVGLDEDAGKFTTFAKNNGLNWKLICDGHGWIGKVATKYGITALPQNFLVDRYGRIFARNLSGKDFDAAITKALAYKLPAAPKPAAK